MINATQDACNAIMKAAREQSSRLSSELSDALDTKEAAAVAFNDAMTAVAARRADADKMQADAIRTFNSALTNTSSILLALQNQIDAGEIVTGTVVPSTRKPRMVKAAE